MSSTESSEYAVNIRRLVLEGIHKPLEVTHERSLLEGVVSKRYCFLHSTSTEGTYVCTKLSDSHTPDLLADASRPLGG